MSKTDWAGFEKVQMASAWDYKTNPTVKGVLISREEKVGPNESMMYTLQQEDGVNIGVWGNTVLDGRLKNVMIGEEVGIEYLGEAVSPKTKRTYNNFEVYHRVIPMVKIEEGLEVKS
jgi:hypothetical protein